MPNVDNIFELHQFFDALRRSRESALLLDYDGTLSPFQLDRAKAVPYPGVPFLLTEILNMGRTRIVVIAGRPAQEDYPLAWNSSAPRDLGREWFAAYAGGRPL